MCFICLHLFFLWLIKYRKEILLYKIHHQKFFIKKIPEYIQGFISYLQTKGYYFFTTLVVVVFPFSVDFTTYTPAAKSETFTVLFPVTSKDLTNCPFVL